MQLGCYMIPLLLSTIFAGRTLLILLGRLKEPLLHTFERYGEEVIYYPLLELGGWLIAFIMSTWALLLSFNHALQVPQSIIELALPIIPMSYIVVFHQTVHGIGALKSIQPLLNRLHVYPLWYRDLRSRTSRYERRRIAYLWLRLPRRLRAIFNMNDPAFLQWADLVIMGAVMEEDRPLPPINPLNLKVSDPEVAIFRQHISPK